MPRKRRTSFLEDVVSLASMLPWWLSLLLAPISFALFHMLAAMKRAASTPAERVSNALWTSLTVSGELIVPVVFVIAAALAGLRRIRQERIDPKPPRVEPSPPVGHMPEIPNDDLYDAWKDVSKTERDRPPIDTAQWSKELLDALEWKRFELLCAGYFETLGFKSKVAREGADGGVDIHLYANGSSTPSIVVQCKAWKTYKVGIKPIRELLGVMTAAQVSEGIFVTTGSYTAEARECAAANHIDLIDGEDLLRKIAASRPEDHAALLKLATAGDFTTPTCPSCGIKMVERVAQKTGDKFWGCTRFPACRLTLRQRSS
jgi:restriction system protein